jgi:MFS family permease
MIGIFIMYLGLIISSINETIAKPFIQLYLQHNIESNSILILLIYFPSAIISQLISPKLGELSDKFNEFSGIAVCCILGASITYFLIHASTGLEFCIILICDQSLARLNGLIMQNIMSRTQPAHRGMLLGMKTWMGHLGEMTGPILGGFLYDTYGDQAPFTTSIFIELFVIPIFF